MILRKISKHEVESQPYLVWNAFIDLLATEDYNDLSPEQRVAHLVFWYDSEVQNGGHLQYFENQGTHHLKQTIQALGALSADCQQIVLRDAGEVWLSCPRPRIETVEAYCETALEGEFDEFDRRFSSCEPDLERKLEEYLRGHLASFVVITDDPVT